MSKNWTGQTDSKGIYSSGRERSHPGERERERERRVAAPPHRMHQFLLKFALFRPNTHTHTHTRTASSRHQSVSQATKGKLRLIQVT